MTDTVWVGIGGLGAAMLVLMGCPTAPNPGARIEPPTTDLGAATDLSGRPDTPDGAGSPRRAPECQAPADCPSGDPCRMAACVDGHCTWRPAEEPCQDGDPCTKDDHCTPVGCVGTAYACGAPCLSCDGQGACLVVPARCYIQGQCYEPGAPSPQAPCEQCAPQQDRRAWSLRPAGAPCDDGEPCTAQDRCQGGVCAGEPLSDGDCGPKPPEPPPPCQSAADCDDQNPCTADLCSDAATCLHLPAPLDCDDGNACTVGDACAGGQCAGGAPLACDDGEPCTLDTCEPQTGCVSVPACDDGDPCTLDLCDASGGCAHPWSQAPCDDGNPCTQPDLCSQGQCTPGPPTDCDDGLACSTDACDPAVGCVHGGTCCGVLGVTCPEGFACTAFGSCESDTEVFVPAGIGWMGSTWKVSDSPQGAGGLAGAADRTWPPVEVYLSAFVIDRTEVTVSAYAPCVEAGVCALPPDDLESDPYAPSSWYWPEAALLPITSVTWSNAQAFCNMMGKTLPTSAQWERAARGGCETVDGPCPQKLRRYPWGDAIPTCELAVFNDWAATSPDCNQGIQPVGSRPAGRSPYGALDMAGNVVEWTGDWFYPYYYCLGPKQLEHVGGYDLEVQCAAVTEAFFDPDDPHYGKPWVDPPGANPYPYWPRRAVRGGAATSSAFGIAASTLSGGERPDVPVHGPIGFRCARPWTP